MSDVTTITAAHCIVTLDCGTEVVFGCSEKGSVHMRVEPQQFQICGMTVELKVTPTWDREYANTGVKKSVKQAWLKRCEALVPGITMQEALDRLQELANTKRAEYAAKQAAYAAQKGGLS